MDLTTTYMGLRLTHPVVPSSSPLTRTLDGVKRLAESGASAVVLHSLFEEQIRFEADRLQHFLSYGTYRFAESLTYYPPVETYHLSTDTYLDLIRGAKQAVGIPVIASLNGISAGGWTEYAKEIEQAGADAIELNVYFVPADVTMTGAEVEALYLSVLEAVRRTVRLPVGMKLSPYFSATANIVKKLDEAGAAAFALFNRFYQPVLDVANLEVRPDLVLSTPYESRLPIRWAAILKGKVKASLAVTSGIHTADGVAQAVAAGADAVYVCSVLLKEGPGKLADLVGGLGRWLECHKYGSLAEAKGVLSQERAPDAVAFERANYLKTLNAYAWPGAERVS